MNPASLRCSEVFFAEGKRPPPTWNISHSTQNTHWISLQLISLKSHQDLKRRRTLVEKRISVNCEALLRARALRYCGVDDDPMRRVLLAPLTNTGA